MVRNGVAPRVDSIRMARGLLQCGAMQRSRRNRGFTLIELAIVVTIVGVLAVIAVVGYRKLTLNAKITEAQNMISGIRIAQEAYKAEKGSYLLVGPAYCPADGTATANVNTKTQWNPACTGGSATWAALPVHSDGPVQFGYRTTASPTAFTITWANTTRLPADKPWYEVHAAADLDGQGGLFTELLATSQSNQVFVKNAGE